MSYAKTCPVCGEIFFSTRKNRIYCSRSCTGRARMLSRIDANPTIQPEPTRAGACCFCPEGVDCVSRRCDSCGHNPVVAAARLARIKLDLQRGRVTNHDIKEN